MKKSIIIFIIFLLSSCFFGSEEDKKVEVKDILQTFENKNFIIEVPKLWKVTKDTTNILPKPASGDIVFIASSDKSINNFKRNLLILKQSIDNNTSSLDYIISNTIGSKKEYFYIKDIGEKNVKIDGKNTRIYESEIKYSEDTPIIRNIQTGIVCNNKGYIINIALEKDNKNLDRYEKLLGTFKCKTPNTPLEGE